MKLSSSSGLQQCKRVIFAGNYIALRGKFRTFKEDEKKNSMGYVQMLQDIPTLATRLEHTPEDYLQVIAGRNL